MGKKFEDLLQLCRERAYGAERRGRRIFWWRNEDPGSRWESHGVADAWEDISLDHSLRNSQRVEQGTPPEKVK